jgi:hypothetical protein
MNQKLLALYGLKLAREHAGLKSERIATGSGPRFYAESYASDISARLQAIGQHRVNGH